MKLTRWMLAAALAMTAGGLTFAADEKPADKPKITEGSCCDKAKKAGKECAHPCCVEAAKKNEVCTKCNKQAK
ncbi:MAG TPA: hypothetical protein VF796_02455 [Humisphaera sp.]